MACTCSELWGFGGAGRRANYVHLNPERKHRQPKATRMARIFWERTDKRSSGRGEDSAQNEEMLDTHDENTKDNTGKAV